MKKISTDKILLDTFPTRDVLHDEISELSFYDELISLFEKSSKHSQKLKYVIIDVAGILYAIKELELGCDERELYRLNENEKKLFRKLSNLANFYLNSGGSIQEIEFGCIVSLGLAEKNKNEYVNTLINICRKHLSNIKNGVFSKPSIRDALLFSFGNMGKLTTKALPLLIQFPHNAEPKLYDIFVSLGEDSIPYLIEDAKTTNSKNKRSYAIETLGRIGLDKHNALEFCLSFMPDTSSIKAIGGFRKHAKRLVPLLLEILAESDRENRIDGDIIDSILNFKEQAVPILKDYITKKRKEVRKLPYKRFITFIPSEDDWEYDEDAPDKPISKSIYPRETFYEKFLKKVYECYIKLSYYQPEILEEIREILEKGTPHEIIDVLFDNIDYCPIRIDFLIPVLVKRYVTSKKYLSICRIFKIYDYLSVREAIPYLESKNVKNISNALELISKINSYKPESTEVILSNLQKRKKLTHVAMLCFNQLKFRDKVISEYDKQKEFYQYPSCYVNPDVGTVDLKRKVTGYVCLDRYRKDSAGHEWKFDEWIDDNDRYFFFDEDFWMNSQRRGLFLTTAHPVYALAMVSCQDYEIPQIDVYEVIGLGPNLVWTYMVGKYGIYRIKRVKLIRKISREELSNLFVEKPIDLTKYETWRKAEIYLKYLKKFPKMSLEEIRMNVNIESYLEK